MIRDVRQHKRNASWTTRFVVLCLSTVLLATVISFIPNRRSRSYSPKSRCLAEEHWSRHILARPNGGQSKVMSTSHLVQMAISQENVGNEEMGRTKNKGVRFVISKIIYLFIYEMLSLRVPVSILGFLQDVR